MTDNKKFGIDNIYFCSTCLLVEKIISSPITYILIPIAIATSSILYLTDLNIKRTLLMLALACMTTGAFVGFLFGLPKRTRYSDKNNLKLNPDEDTLQPNTNLQEVSDWLTKIIIGVGLIQFNQIYQGLDTLAVKIGSSIQGIQTYDYSMFALAIIIFYIIIGFIGGYLGTVIKITSELSKADKELFGRVKELTKKVHDIKEEVRKHDDISNVVAVADRMLTKVDLYKDLANQNDDIRLKRSKYLDMSRMLLDQIINNDDYDGLSNIPAVFALEHYFRSLDVPDYENSIKVLSRAIDFIGDPTGDHQHRVALHRLYYNRACAKYLLSHDFSDAKPDLSKAIHYQSFYKKFALIDDDWKEMLDNDEFIKLTS